MQTVLRHAYVRRATVVVPTTAGVPAAQAATVTATGANANPTGNGLYALSEQLDTQLSVDAGAPRTVTLLPFAAGGSATFVLAAYGLRLIGGAWHPVMLFVGSCVCDVAVTGTSAADSVSTSDKRASAITPTGTWPADDVKVCPGLPGHVEVATKGCPFLLFTASDAAGRVAVAPVS